MGTTTQAYLEILEKTNQQLSLWYNPYGLMVAALTGLVALLAIVFAFVLWRQGKDYSDARKKFFEEQEKTIGSRIDALTQAALIERIKILNEEMGRVTGKAKEDLQQEIDAVR